MYVTRPIFKVCPLARNRYISGAYLIVDLPMPEPKSRIVFDHIKCSGCFSLICIGVCPQGILETDDKGKPRVAEVSECTLCGVCVNLCPRKAISIDSGSIER